MTLLDDLAGAVGPGRVLTGADGGAGPYAVDYTGRFGGEPAAVVLPGTVAEVAAVVDACRRHRTPLVPQGGNTGLVGGGVPTRGEVVVSLARLDTVADVDASAGQLTAGAGVTLAAVRRAAQAAGWAYGVDFASRDRATVGGMVATNAGGLHVVRHGDTRAQVVGVEAVMADGSVVSRLGGLTRDNAGFHLPSLLCGSEGTLGVITAARLRLVAEAPERAVALIGFPTTGAALEAASALRRLLPAVEAVELVLAAGLDLVCQTMALDRPLAADHAAYLVVEVAGSEGSGRALEDAAGRLSASTGAMALATGPGERRRLWAYREKHTEAVATLGVAHKLDVALPLGRLRQFVEEVPAVVAGIAPGARTWLWGHAGEGNVHVNLTGLAPDDERADDAVLRLVVGLGGSISAEHGIGTAKRRWLALTRSPAELTAYRAVKRALDPTGVLNPNALLPPD
ncbi:MAG: FAD-binding oxidoreductase [Actinomycetota bacterium]